ncbi:MAG: S9 family peptidase [Defluviitaleaceae bacterium]|nr:S9 family peptidase [Defluviitaleaceae bacterium]
MEKAKENIKIDEFKNFTFLNRLKYSPDGTKSAVVGSKASFVNDYHKTIFVDKGEGYFPLTSVIGKVGSYIWLCDEHILFAETRCKKAKEKIEKGHELTAFQKIGVSGGEAIWQFNIPAVVESIESLPKDTFLVKTLFDNTRPNLEGKSKGEAEALLKEHKKEADYQVIDELPYWFNGRGFINKKRQRLATFCKKGGLVYITGPMDDVASHKLSPCKKFVLFYGDRAPFDIHDTKSNLYLLNIETGEEKALLPEKMLIRYFDFWEDKVVLAASTGEKLSLNENPCFYLVGQDGQGFKKLAEYDRSVGTCATTDSRFNGGTVAKVYGDSYYFTSLIGFNADVHKLCLASGKIENVTNSGANVEMFDITDDAIIYTCMNGLELQEVYELKDGTTTKKSNFNEAALENKKLSTPEHHTITDPDGFEIDGWVMKPVCYKPGQKYPAILDIHGGPKAAYGDMYFHEMQYWANCGYFVMFSNPRGGDGKGNEFSDIRGKYGTVDYDNLMQFTDEMCAKYPDIDTTRLGVTGGSYGGFMTNWIVGHNTKFAAAATQRSICNWISKSNTTDIGYFFNTDQIQADAWGDLEKIWWHSPLKYAPNVKTPTLILHSDEDYRCWITEAYQWFTALKIHGVETRLHIFKGENHELSRAGKPDHRVRRIKEITDWMDKYLKS